MKLITSNYAYTTALYTWDGFIWTNNKNRTRGIHIKFIKNVFLSFDYMTHNFVLWAKFCIPHPEFIYDGILWKLWLVPLNEINVNNYSIFDGSREMAIKHLENMNEIISLHEEL
jgi:hypothetical protein